MQSRPRPWPHSSQQHYCRRPPGLPRPSHRTTSLRWPPSTNTAAPLFFFLCLLFTIKPCRSGGLLVPLPPCVCIDITSTCFPCHLDQKLVLSSYRSRPVSRVASPNCVRVDTSKLRALVIAVMCSSPSLVSDHQARWKPCSISTTIAPFLPIHQFFQSCDRRPQSYVRHRQPHHELHHPPIIATGVGPIVGFSTLLLCFFSPLRPFF